MSTHAAPDVGTLALNPAAFTPDELADYGGTLTGLARRAGLAPSTLARCARGELAPGPVVIAALLQTTGKPFDQLFLVTSLAPRSSP